MQLLTEPSLDIVAFLPVPIDGDRRVSTISALTQSVFERGMADRNLYLAKLNVKPERLEGVITLDWDQPAVTILRSVLMKPEHLAHVPELHRRVLSALGE